MKHKDEAVRLDERINGVYKTFAPLAERYGFTFVRPQMMVGGRANVLFLGNHSAGKSTFINDLLDGDDVQDTGVAPTDDGFTLIRYGETDQDFYGPAAIPYLTQDFSALEKLGPTFTQRLKVRVRNREILKVINLIDSPGMIDSAETGATRDYDFMEAVTRMANVADLVLFLFDPGKPGTTGESLQALSQCLHGMEFKLRILMNKADTFDNLYDFARAYGALCWNLARVVHTKDLPPVFTTYIEGAGSPAGGIDLHDFDVSHKKVVEEITLAPQRRRDNMVAMVQDDQFRLAVHCDVATAFRKALLSYVGIRSVAAVLLSAGIGALAGWAALKGLSGMMWLAYAIGGLSFVGAGLVSAWILQVIYRSRASVLAEDLDDVFKHVYRRKMTIEQRDDLNQAWDVQRKVLKSILKGFSYKVPMNPGRLRRKLDASLEEKNYG